MLFFLQKQKFYFKCKFFLCLSVGYRTYVHKNVHTFNLYVLYPGCVLQDAVVSITFNLSPFFFLYFVPHSFISKQIKLKTTIAHENFKKGLIWSLSCTLYVRIETKNLPCVMKLVKLSNPFFNLSFQTFISVWKHIVLIINKGKKNSEIFEKQKDDHF